MVAVGVGEPAVNGARRGRRDPRIDRSTARRDCDENSGGVGGQRLFGRGGSLETQVVPAASSAPLAPPNVGSGVMLRALAETGLSPFASQNSLTPVPSPALWAVLAWVRRQPQQTQSSFGRMFPVTVSSEEKAALAPLNQQTNEQFAELAQGTLAEVVSPSSWKPDPAAVQFLGDYSTANLSQWTTVQNVLHNGRPWITAAVTR